jgi:hypothetical protein
MADLASSAVTDGNFNIAFEVGRPREFQRKGKVPVFLVDDPHATSLIYEWRLNHDAQGVVVNYSLTRETFKSMQYVCYLVCWHSFIVLNTGTLV